MKGFFRERLGGIITAAALKALMTEAAITPKPGLVDRANSGSHRDMDFFTFIDSTAAILPCFRECAVMGYDSAADSTAEAPSAKPPALFESLRPVGKAAECLMKQATGGVNVHKGIIFSLAILSAAYGVLYNKSDVIQLADLLDLCRAMCSRLPEDFSNPSDFSSQQNKSSHGEAAFARHGIQGIRGEAAAGFPSVRDHSLPVLRRMLKEGHSLNDSGIAAFLSLLARVDDTNIIHRSDLSSLRRIQKETGEFLRGNPAMSAIRERTAELDRQFIAANISPGGCADLLALTLFLNAIVPDD